MPLALATSIGAAPDLVETGEGCIVGGDDRCKRSASKRSGVATESIPPGGVEGFRPKKAVILPPGVFACFTSAKVEDILRLLGLM